jgi:hypothetical protein
LSRQLGVAAGAVEVQSPAVSMFNLDDDGLIKIAGNCCAKSARCNVQMS